MNPLSAYDEILYMTFNQDHGCFAIGTETGFKIFYSFPFKEAFSRDMGGGIGIIEMLYRSNILALVGGGRNPKYPLNKVMIWDDSQMKCIGEMSFRSEVKAVKLRPNRVVVVLDNKIFVYNFADLKLLDHMDTCLNPKGLCSLNLDPENTILAYPDKIPGQVSIHIYGNFGAKDKKKMNIIKAHQSALCGLELNPKGIKLATASEKGTIIRIYNTSDGSFLQELRRGSEYAQIHSISFENSGRWLLCSSENGTVHVFNLKLTEKEKADLDISENEIKNPKSKFAFMKVVLPYFDSEWSFAQFRIQDSKSLVSFSPDSDSLIVTTFDGNYYLANFDSANGGECQTKKQLKFVSFEEIEK